MSQVLQRGTFLAFKQNKTKKRQVLAFFFFFFNCEKKLDGEGLESKTDL